MVEAGTLFHYLKKNSFEHSEPYFISLLQDLTNPFDKQGLNDVVRQDAVSLLVRDTAATIVCLQETKRQPGCCAMLGGCKIHKQFCHPAGCPNKRRHPSRSK